MDETQSADPQIVSCSCGLTFPAIPVGRHLTTRGGKKICHKIFGHIKYSFYICTVNQNIDTMDTLDREVVKGMNHKYVGRRIVCVEMNNDPDPIPSGTVGTVQSVDSCGTLHTKWDNGRSLGLLPNEDKYRFVEEDKRMCTEPLFWGCNLFYNLKCEGCPKFL